MRPSWGVPLMLIGGLFMLRAFRHADCRTFSEIYPHLLFFIPLILSWMYSLVESSFDDLISIVKRSHTPKIVRTSILFLVSFAACWVWSLLVVILLLVNPTSVMMRGFLSLSYIFTPLQGFINALVYGLHEDLWIKMKEMLKNRWSHFMISTNENYANEYPDHNASLLYFPSYEDEEDEVYTYPKPPSAVSQQHVDNVFDVEPDHRRHTIN
eukprot:gene14171-16703_t